MTANHFRFLLIASIMTMVAGMVYDIVFPLPADFLLAMENQDKQIISSSPWKLVLLGVLSIFLIVAIIFSYYGLFRLRAWAPRLAFWASALSFLVYPFHGCFAQSGVTSLFYTLSVLIWGAVLAISLSPAYKARFQASSGPEQHESGGLVS
ncbi:MAG: hypothetical protein LBU11_00935 [Zoogloeaceae bacterium]|jgi:hypothetical protein|nr:hypothetical protein [Zoogloeaceae bacterium]